MGGRWEKLITERPRPDERVAFDSTACLLFADICIAAHITMNTECHLENADAYPRVTDRSIGHFSTFSSISIIRSVIWLNK